MIICDKCEEKRQAEYFVSVDYLRTKNISSFHLCEKHYSELERWISEKDSKLDHSGIDSTEVEVDVEKSAKKGRARKTK